MKILFLSSAESIHTQRWVNSLACRGYEIILASQHNPIGRFENNVKFYRLKYTSIFGYFLNVNQLKRIEKLERPDIIHAHFASGYGTLAANCGFKYLLSVWGSDIYEFPDKSFFHRFLIRRVLNNAVDIFSTSHCMKQRTSEFTKKNINVIPFGVDTDKFKPGARFRKDRIVIGLIKVLNEKYGIDILLKAFSILKKTNGFENVRLQVAGDGPKKNDYENLARNLHIENHVDFLGWLNNSCVPNFLTKLDIFVVPSRWDGESFGVVAVEAGAASLPTIVSNVGGLPEVVIDGITGIVVPKENPKVLAEKIMDLIKNPSLARSLGINARSRVLQHYEWANNVDAMTHYYESMKD